MLRSRLGRYRLIVRGDDNGSGLRCLRGIVFAACELRRVPGAGGVGVDGAAGLRGVVLWIAGWGLVASGGGLGADGEGRGRRGRC